MQQFLLLFRKNLILWKRNKLWTVFEIIIPCILMAIYIGFLLNNGSKGSPITKKFEKFQIRGNAEDFSLMNDCTSNIKFGYSSSPELQNETKKIMNNFRKNFKNPDFNVMRLNSEDEIKKNLRKVAKNFEETYVYNECALQNYRLSSGVFFDEIDFDQQILKYRLIYSTFDHHWLVRKRIVVPYLRNEEDTSYKGNGFLTYQHAIESSFIDIINSSNNSNPILNFEAFPEPEIVMKIIFLHIQSYPFLLSIIIFINVVHVTREVSAENENLKGYLMTLGLSNFNFYLTHILSGICKLVFLISMLILPFWMKEYLYFDHITILSIVIILYGISAITFGAFIASFFSTSNSAIKASITVWAMLLGLFVFLHPENHQEIIKFYIYALIPTGAFQLACDILVELIIDDKELTIFNIFSGSSSRFTLGNAVSMLVFDIVLMFGIALFVDDYRRSNDVSFKEFLKSSLAKYGSKSVESIKMSELQESEDLLKDSNENRNEDVENGIIVSKLVKIWGTTGEKAINGLSFEAKKGEVTILFGQNGDGKSTTFHCISGMIPVTEGRILISGRESNTNLNIGLCPQYNPIFDQLTVKEHLWFINGLKGNKNNRKFQAEMNRLLENVKLTDKKHEFSSNLSGGMKRKLCVCMALIGSSEVVLLDEPTAGMDPGARKDVQDLLEREKQHRTILLTTHYMDEAERLGDWILIMSHGKLVSSGTPKFLKQKYGTGYLLTVVLDDGINKHRDNICEVLQELCKFYISEAQLGNTHGKQIEVILPENRKSDFPILFRALETIQRKEYTSEIFFILPNELKDKLKTLQITDYGLSLNSLEQVILTLSEQIGTNETNGIVNQNHEFETTKFENLLENQSELPEKTGISLMISQTSAIFRKKYLYTRRRWSQLIGQLFLPLLIIGLIWLIVRVKIHQKLASDMFEKGYNLEEFSPAVVVWKADKDSLSEHLLKIIKIVDRVSGFDCQYDEKSELLNIAGELYGKIPPLLFGFTENTTLFNYQNQHILPALISLNNQARLLEEKASTIECRINLYMENKYKIDFADSTSESVLSGFFLVIFSLVTSSFVIFLVEEKVSKFAHQQLLTGISPITLYVTSMIFDFLEFSAICSIFLIFFYLFDFLLEHLTNIILFWFLYFISNVPFIYIISQYFKSPSKARVFLVIWQIFIPAALIILIYFVIDSTRGGRYLTPRSEFFGFVKLFLECIFSFFVPSFSFGTILLEFIDNGMYNYFYMEVRRFIISMVLFSIASSIVFIALQFKTIRKYLSNKFSSGKIGGENERRSDLDISDSVVLEKQKAENANAMDYSLVVKNLTKKFGNFTALDNLSLAISSNECFGLLGVNGCGKTTTFDILTGYSFATSGEAKIGGKDVTDRIGIGYCPQFDSILLDLTGREILEILGKMHGFRNYQQKAEIILESIGMQKQSNKLCRYYSGGQKRKISIGIALLSTNSMIILDEPTAGIDPKARREIWELLIWSRQQQNDGNSAIMLTSHSMDECEALCSRIAVLNQGKLIAIGSSQELKSLYGNNYTMTLTLNDSQDRENIVNSVKNQIPGAILRTPESNKTLNIVWLIPKNLEDKWSDKFEMVQNLARQLNVKDYILAQSSLEETFLRLAGVNQENV
ncbi:unnamed protein product [Caenorhabditis angaria]|uniref:ABC transporter domain-containing protein n=1 Tax=Caenorhabditis angaria TaxID=860376 RepID=A0A9P1MXP6_9PELO|nr:unnamed protein product [Caenorhabditis angaria]